MVKIPQLLIDLRTNLRNRWHGIDPQMFFKLCVTLNTVLYTLYLCWQGYLSVRQGAKPFELAVNACVGAVTTGTVFMFISGLMDFKRLRPYVPIVFVALSGLSTFGIVGVSVSMYASGALLAGFIAANLMKGSTFPFAYFIDRLAERLKWAGVDENGKLLRTPNDKLWEVGRMVIALTGVGFMIWANYLKNKAKLTPSGLNLLVFLLMGAAMSYSIFYAYRQALMIYVNYRLRMTLAHLPKDERAQEIRSVISCLIGVDQFFCALSMIVAILALGHFGYLDHIHWHLSWMVSGIPYGLLAYFSAMILAAPVKKDDLEKPGVSTMLFKTLMQKLGGVIAALNQAVFLAVVFGKGYPSWREWVGASIVVFAILFGRQPVMSIFGAGRKLWRKKVEGHFGKQNAGRNSVQTSPLGSTR